MLVAAVWLWLVVIGAPTATAANLERNAFDRKSIGVGHGRDRPRLRIELLGRAAAVADQEGGGVHRLMTIARNEGIDPGDPVHQAYSLQKFQSAVDSRRLGGYATNTVRGSGRQDVRTGTRRPVSMNGRTMKSIV